LSNVEIVAVSAGGSEVEQILRIALAMGADRAILAEIESELDPGMVTAILHAVAVSEQPQLILMGKQAIDDDNSQIGPRLAAKLEVPQATFASAIELLENGASARVTREVDGGQEVIEVRLPAVITADLRLNEPRYVALPAIIKARTKPLQRVNAEELCTLPSPQIRVIHRSLPPDRKAGRRVANVPELISLLRSEAKVI